MSKLQSESLLRFWSDLMADFPRCCITNMAYEVIHMDFEVLTDIGSLPFSIETAHQYLRLQDGDIVLTNDPYSGGTVLSSPTLIMGVGQRPQKGSIPAEFLIAARITLMPKLGQFKTIDEEGLRIPPSPIVTKEVINEALFDALRSHPQAPEHLESRLRAMIDQLLQLRTEIKRWMTWGKIDLSRTAVRKLHQHTNKRFTSLIEDYREGEALIEYGISKTEIIRLHTELKNGRFTFDFSGTSTGQDIFLTSSAALGVCVGTTLALLPNRVPINGGILNCFDVKAPRGSLVNSSFPQPLQLGHTDGVNLVAHVVLQTLAKIDERLLTAGNGYSHCHYELLFENGTHYISALPSGMGASERGPGLSGGEVWRRFKRDWSIESLERTFPLEFQSYTRRTNSGGDGKHAGGDGMAQTIRVNSAGKFSWFYMEPEHKPIGVNGGKTALGPAVILKRQGHEKTELPWRGTIPVQVGDEITLLSPGGGGFGS